MGLERSTARGATKARREQVERAAVGTTSELRLKVRGHQHGAMFAPCCEASRKRDTMTGVSVLNTYKDNLYWLAMQRFDEALHYDLEIDSQMIAESEGFYRVSDLAKIAYDEALNATIREMQTMVKAWMAS